MSNNKKRVTMNQVIKEKFSAKGEMKKDFVPDALEMVADLPETATRNSTYNSGIFDIAEKFKKIGAANGILVRCFLREPVENEEGKMILDDDMYFPVPTNSGVGQFAKVKNPWPFTGKAVVIASPAHLTYIKEGMIVYLNKQVILPTPLGSGKEVQLVLKKAFMHPDSVHVAPPIDPNDEDFGYMTVGINDIEYYEKVD